jgi:hypothetical protein
MLLLLTLGDLPAQPLTGGLLDGGGNLFGRLDRFGWFDGRGPPFKSVLIQPQSLGDGADSMSAGQLGGQIPQRTGDPFSTVPRFSPNLELTAGRSNLHRK